jgi:hypothetical protein
MEMRQIQEMLREMGVPYPPDATKETLVEILKQENHKQWLKSSASRIVKAKKRKTVTNHGEVQRPGPKRHVIAKPASALRRPIQHVGASAAAGERVEKAIPTSQISQKSAPLASNVCDLCENGGMDLVAYPISEKPGTKHIAALCPDCIAKAKGQFSEKELKVLKRKARIRSNVDPQVTYGRVKNSWGYKPE